MLARWFYREDPEGDKEIIKESKTWCFFMVFVVDKPLHT